MPTLTHILVATLALAVVLIYHVVTHRRPRPVCEVCGLYYCPGGRECVARPPDDVCEGIDSKSGGT